MVTLKSAREFAAMRRAGLVVHDTLDLVRRMTVPGRKTIEIDQAAEAFYRQAGAIPLFKGVPHPKGKARPFPGVICISVNEQVVHGIPGSRVIAEGDIVSVDTGCKLEGWCADAATTIAVGKVHPLVKRLVEATERTLEIAIEEMGRQRRWSQVAQKMQDYVRSQGFHVVEQYVGHGIGREMHEEPQVPNFVSRALLKNDFWLEEGLVLAIEPMVNMGTKVVRELSDRWTVETKDRRPSAHFEHTVAVTREGPLVLTAAPGEERRYQSEPTGAAPAAEGHA